MHAMIMCLNFSEMNIDDVTGSFGITGRALKNDLVLSILCQNSLKNSQ